MKKYPIVSYVPRNLFSALMEAKKTLPEVIELTQGNSKHNCVSPITLEIIQNTNSTIDRVLFNEGEIAACAGRTPNPLTIPEKDYAKDTAVNYLKTDNSCNLEKCYEIIIDSSTEVLSILVVVEEGFLSFVTETKEKLSCFILTLLRHSHDHGGSMYSLGRKFLGLKLNEGYLDLVKLRLDRR